MKKKILFLISNLESGGVSKSMVSLLNAVDKKEYDVSLWVGHLGGLYFDMLPKSDLTIIHDEKVALLSRGAKGILGLMKRGCFLLALGSLIRMILSVVNKGWAGWWLSRLYPKVDGEYDLIVDYNGQQQLYFMVDKLKGRKKVSFFHSDYSKWPYYYNVDKKYYPKVDAIFTISDICVNSLKNYFPGEANKIFLMENISSPTLIQNMANESILDWPETKDSVFVTIGHVSTAKGTDLAIETASILKKREINFQWLFIGAVSDKNKYDALVRKWDVEDCISFLGLRVNPYPYIQRATLFVHPSQFEGKSIALDEAKILCKPIVVTNFSTVYDQFEDRVNASICEMIPESLADAIEELLRNEQLQMCYQKYLRQHITDNSSEVNKLYALFDK